MTPSLEHFFQTSLLTLGVMVACFTLAWAVYLLTKRASLVDGLWGLVVLFALWIVYSNSNPDMLGNTLLACSSLWALRLSAYLLKRNTGKHEDSRYAAMIHTWGPSAKWMMWRFYLSQALAATFLVLPLYPALNGSIDFMPLYTLGLSVFTLGFVGEWLADHQLARFKSSRPPAGAIMEQGLWRYSRHPNYFFEWVVWCGLGLIALSSAQGWPSLISALIMYMLLRFATGIPETERQMLKSRGEPYLHYQKRVPPFFPQVQFFKNRSSK